MKRIDHVTRIILYLIIGSLPIIDLIQRTYIYTGITAGFFLILIIEELSKVLAWTPEKTK